MTRVLVIEADATTRVQLQALLERDGFEPVVVGDADSAIEVLESGQAPALVVMGWGVPGADGLEMLRWVRSRPACAGTWVLVLTGHSRREDEIAALDAGADDYMVKPVHAARLRAHLRAGARRATRPGSRGDAPGRAAA